MFTGIIEKVGKFTGLRKSSTGIELCIAHTPWDVSLTVGESVAVQGVCLTVIRMDKNHFMCNILRETLKKTNLGNTPQGSLVNIERAVKTGDRFGGHFLSGHVDGIGKVTRLNIVGYDRILSVECDAELAHGIVLKGSIACDGVSLTVAKVSHHSFDVNLIPLTWERTSLHRLSAGDLVNIEVDIIGKYVQRYMIAQYKGASEITMETLHNAGFA